MMDNSKVYANYLYTLMFASIKLDCQFSTMIEEKKENEKWGRTTKSTCIISSLFHYFILSAFTQSFYFVFRLCRYWFLITKAKPFVMMNQPICLFFSFVLFLLHFSESQLILNKTISNTVGSILCLTPSYLPFVMLCRFHHRYCWFYWSSVSVPIPFH